MNKRKYKKEMKSAIKEIRRDNEFISRVQFKETMEKYEILIIRFNFSQKICVWRDDLILFHWINRDTQRNKKVKEILGSLSMQEGEYRKHKRLKQ